MKLIYCDQCKDIVALRFQTRYCLCGKSGGHYTDKLCAEIFGPCIPLGFANSSFIDAKNNQPDKPFQPEALFTAFIIEKDCPTVTVLPDTESEAIT